MRYILGFFTIVGVALLAWLIYLYSHIRFDIDKIVNYNPIQTTQFFDKNGKLIPDTFEDEVFLAAVLNNKLVVFTGCAHNGVENMVSTAIDYTQINEVEFVVGGTHLNRASEEQIQKTILALSQFSINRAAFNHCSGQHNIPRMDKALNGKIEYAYAGCNYHL